MVLGAYYLTYGPDDEELAELEEKAFGGKWDEKKDGKRPHVFRSAQEAELSYEHGMVKLHDLAEYRRRHGRRSTCSPPSGGSSSTSASSARWRSRSRTSTTRPTYEFVNQPLKKRDMGDVIEGLVDQHGPYATALVLDAFKDVGFHFATQAGITISKNDVVIPPNEGGDPRRATRARSARSRTSTTRA